MSSTSNVGGHGASVKSWIACLVIVVGFVLGGVAMIIWNWPMFIATDRKSTRLNSSH